jgi:hypothetical protein
MCVGHRYAQIIFMKCPSYTESNSDMNYAETGKYQSTQNFLLIQKYWNPYRMLGKKHLDREVHPVNYKKPLSLTSSASTTATTASDQTKTEFRYYPFGTTSVTGILSSSDKRHFREYWMNMLVIPIYPFLNVTSIEEIDVATSSIMNILQPNLKFVDTTTPIPPITYKEFWAVKKHLSGENLDFHDCSSLDFRRSFLDLHFRLLDIPNFTYHVESWFRDREESNYTRTGGTKGLFNMFTEAEPYYYTRDDIGWPMYSDPDFIPLLYLAYLHLIKTDIFVILKKQQIDKSIDSLWKETVYEFMSTIMTKQI